MSGDRHISYYRLNVAGFEDIAEFNLFNNTMLAKLAPVGCMETVLAERIVSLSWRLKRAAYMQKAVMECLSAEAAARMQAKPPQSAPCEGAKQPQDAAAAHDEEAAVARMVLKDFGEARVVEGLLRYEQRIEQSLQRTKKEFQRLQRRRLKETGKHGTGGPPADWEEQSPPWDLPPID
jgi:hypothetical protein